VHESVDLTRGVRLRAAPDWVGAAEVLIQACSDHPDEETRVRWMEQICLRLGDALYPAFLRVLCVVGEQGTALAQRRVASTLLAALLSDRLPAGRQSAWGAQRMAASRSHGPLEYLCAWHLHPNGAELLPAARFDRAARSLLGLIGHDPQAHALYRSRLLAAADDPLEGTWSRTDRIALRALAQAWSGGDAQAAVSAFLKAPGQSPAVPSLSPWERAGVRAGFGAPPPSP